MIGPELGVTQPGMTIVCGDSHTATHGAFGALAFGIGTSEVEHVLATQCLVQTKPKSMRIRYQGDARVRGHRQGPDPRDDRPDRRRRRGRHVVEYAGPAIAALSMEGRMTVCNMTIEGGGRAGMVAPDEDLRVRDRACRRPARGAGGLAGAVLRRGARVRPGGRRRRGDAQPDGDLGDQPRDGRRRRRTPCPSQPPSRTSARWTTWDLKRELRSRRSSWIGCSSGRARTPGSATCGPRFDDRAPSRRRRRLRDGRAGIRTGQGAGRGRGARRGIPGRRLRLARRRLLDVPGDEPGHRGAG